MQWKSVKLPSGSKLFKSHNFTFVIKGATYQLEIDEYSDGSFTGHGEHSTDPSSVVASVSAESLEACMQKLVEKVESLT